MPKDPALLQEAGRKVLKALAASPAPQAPKQIAAAAGLDDKLAGDAIKALKTEGLIDSPVRCKYAITETGRGRL
ncbi:MAG: MarR family transcriptional regulator [Thermodesulfobacteriota bacterium]|jgi:predicted transcriptional regulator